MKQGKVSLELTELLIQNDIVDAVRYDLLFSVLGQAYAAGWDEGRMNRMNRKPVMQITLNGEPVQVFDSTVVAARKLDVDQSCISKAAQGKVDTVKGYRWKYI